ncbi:MAG: hypothetical protein KAV87_03085 [Desulfobacteraceae bacterium]|nr:hypothetical protein [Desulfobacteraceae bacterium]
MKAYRAESESRYRQTIDLLCATAIKGLVDCYSEKGLSDRGRSFNGREVRLNMASHLRYIIIAQIGIKRWLLSCDCNTQLPDFWEHIESRSNEIDNAGDLGLAIWAGVESDVDDARILAERLAEKWTRMRRACNAVELAWVVQGMTCLSQRHSMTDEMNSVLKDAHDRLMDLYCQDTRLLARHNRKGAGGFVSRHIACFADQVYPILALASYGQAFDDGESIEAAVAVADTMCLLQGNEGQWWWHYDVKTGTVVEEYPVFSVHQDGMAPMALLAIDRVAGTDHSSFIEKGMMWLNRSNELNAAMVLHEQGVIWRDIHRREIGKMYRLARGLLFTAGLGKAHRLSGKNVFGYVVNRECRPYHLGWILYAWAN